MKRIFALILTFTLTMLLVSCAPVDMENTDETTKTIQNINKANDYNIRLWIDENTGVQYIIYHFSAPNKAGAGITPRLNADGSLYIEE